VANKTIRFSSAFGQLTMPLMSADEGLFSWLFF